MRMPHLSRLVAPCTMLILLIVGSHQGYIAWKDYKKVVTKLASADVAPQQHGDDGRDFSLFTAAVVPQTPKVAKVALTAEVAGIVASDEAWRSFATIKTPTGQENYREGDNLNGYQDTWIETINQDSVVIHYQGANQTLALKKPDYFKGISGSTPPEKPKDTLASLHLNDYFVLKPLVAKGQLKGYLINPRNASESFAESGFKQGDVVVKVDTSDMTQSSQAHNIIENWSHMNKADVTVRRHEHLQNIQVNLLNN